MAIAAKKFSQESFDPVANNGLTYACADSDAEPAFSLVVWFADNKEVGSVNLFP
jgi:hypothetical protein